MKMTSSNSSTSGGRATPFSLFLSVILLTLLATVPSTKSQEQRGMAAAKERTVTCVFVNPGYSGSCTEKTQASEAVTAEKACQPILDCLNNPQCVKTYCGATSVRAGWTLDSATESGSSASSEQGK